MCYIIRKKAEQVQDVPHCAVVALVVGSAQHVVYHHFVALTDGGMSSCEERAGGTTPALALAAY